MKKRLMLRGSWRLPLLAATVMLVGCQSSLDIKAEAAARYVQFRDQLVFTTQAINAGDLERARAHLGEARAVAARPKQYRKVQSLKQLILGAEALRAGEPDRARVEWARIEERSLSREVRHKARLIGIDVPIVPLEEEATR